MNTNFNFSVSGWTGSGASSLAFILTRLFEFQYVHMGGVFRYIGKELGHSEEGIARPKFDDYIEPIIGPTVDKFRDFILVEQNQLVLDSDLGTFLIGKNPKVFSIFLKSSFESRKEKVIKDEREDAESILVKRDEINQQFFKKMHDIDIYDEELIDRKFNLVIDNSHVSIEEEVRIVVENLQEVYHIDFDARDIQTEIQEVTRDFAVLGKNRFKQDLEERNLVKSPEEIIKEMARNFPEDIAGFPDSIQKIFLGLN